MTYKVGGMVGVELDNNTTVTVKIVGVFDDFYYTEEHISDSDDTLFGELYMDELNHYLVSSGSSSRGN